MFEYYQPIVHKQSLDQYSAEHRKLSKLGPHHVVLIVHYYKKTQPTALCPPITIAMAERLCIFCQENFILVINYPILNVQ